MCGIVGCAGSDQAKDWLLNGLHRLEYRGYDSAGVAIVDDGALDVVCRVGKVDVLDDAVSHMDMPGSVGIGHTRWATHGKPSESNAHPHRDCTGRIAVVHNGIIENYQELKRDLIEQGHVFRSETDTEVVAHLLEKYYRGDLLDAMRKACSELQGSYALAAVCADEPDILVVTRRDNPIVVGTADGVAMVASDMAALIGTTRDLVFIEDDEFARLHSDGTIEFFNRAGARTYPKVQHVDWDIEAAERGGYPDFMLKEMHEQPRVVRDTLAGRFRDGKISLDELKMSPEQLRDVDRVYIIACGTSYHAGLVARTLIEQWARIPTTVEVASEFRYRDPIITPRTLMVAITQSGETADTLEGIKIAHQKGARVLTITNIVGSRAARDSDGVFYTKAGLEIGVAATKSFIAQLVAVSCLALFLGQQVGKLSDQQVAGLFEDLRDTAPQIERILQDETPIRRAADACQHVHSMMFIGRGMGAATCYEGALKLKEISYLHAEAYAAGEIKHGPIALIDENVPVLAIATQSETYTKVISNIEELRSRNARIIAVATDGDNEIRNHADFVFYVPPTDECFSAITATVPLQMFARFMALDRACDPDKPRNLAKSVTVE